MNERAQAVRRLADELMELAAPEGHLVKWPVGAVEGRLNAFLADWGPAAQVVAERDAATATLAKILEREMLRKELEAAKAERDALLERLERIRGVAR